MRQRTVIVVHWTDRAAINTNSAATAINKCKPLISIMLRRAPFLKLAAVQAPDYTNQCARTARTVQVQIHPQHSPRAIIIKLFTFLFCLLSVLCCQSSASPFTVHLHSLALLLRENRSIRECGVSPSALFSRAKADRCRSAPS